MDMVSFRANIEQRILVLLHGAVFVPKSWRGASLLYWSTEGDLMLVFRKLIVRRKLIIAFPANRIFSAYWFSHKTRNDSELREISLRSSVKKREPCITRLFLTQTAMECLLL